MTADWYDLGQRLHAAGAGSPVPRLCRAPLGHASHPVAVRARRRAQTVTVTAAAPGRAEATATGIDALRLLHDLGVTIAASAWRTLVASDSATLPALVTLARSAGPDGDPAAAAAHLAWCAERADFPGSTAAADVTDACRLRWITGSAPDTERHAATWRAWLGIAGDGCAATLDLFDRLQDGGPLALLDAITRDDSHAWAQAQREHADHRDWRRPDSIGRAAAGLRARCDTADLYAAALLTDPLYRWRAVHTGHVVTGTVTVPPEPRAPLTVTCDRMNARPRAGSDITGWAGQPGDTAQEQFHGTITEAAVRGGALVLTLTAGTLGRPATGEPVTLHPAPPGQHVLADGRRRYQQLYATRKSWLTTGRTPAPARRDVPLDVLVAAAADLPAAPGPQNWQET